MRLMTALIIHSVDSPARRGTPVGAVRSPEFSFLRRGSPGEPRCAQMGREQERVASSLFPLFANSGAAANRRCSRNPSESASVTH